MSTRAVEDPSNERDCGRSIEDRMRHLPTLVAFRGQLVPNPERRLLLRRQEAVIATLRRRRTTLRSATRHH